MFKYAVLGLLSLAVMPVAQANCNVSDITGTWVLYQTNISAAVPHTGRCEIRVTDTPARTLTGNCNLSVGVDIPVTGNASVTNSCSAVITMNFDGGNMTFDAQLAPDRQSFVGRWTNSFGDVGGSSGVRK